jgi:hypothetical protein
MISANLTHRHFNIDRGQPITEEEKKRLIAAGLHELSYRGWAVRLNDRIERWMDSVDWMRIDIWLGTVGGVLLVGVSLYLIYIVAEAWLSGAIERAVRP